MLFLDTADLNELEKWSHYGLISGVTTNPSILEKSGVTDMETLVENIVSLYGGIPISLELTRINDIQSMIEDAILLSEINENVVVKVPAFTNGLGHKIAYYLESNHEIPTNLTCMMTPEQMLLGLESNLSYISFFLNRSVDFYTPTLRGKNATQAEKQSTYDRLNDICKLGVLMITDTSIIVGSIRDPQDVTASLLAGVDIVTVPPNILNQMFQCSRTDETIKEFDDKWKKLTGEPQ